MTRFWREAHSRVSSNGSLHWVAGHWVDRDGWGGAPRSSPLAAGPQPNRVTETQRSKGTFRTRCPYCGDEIFFHRADNGGCAFFDRLGAPWDKHPCFDLTRRPTQRPPGEQASAPEPREVTYLQQYPDLVVGWWQIYEGTWAVCVELGHSGDVIMLLTEPGLPLQRCRVAPQAKPGRVILRFPEGPKVGFGPFFECIDRSLWETHEGKGEQLLLLARDLGMNRFRNYIPQSPGGLGEGVTRSEADLLLKPDWKASLRLMLVRLDEGDELAMHEFVSLIEGPAKGVLPKGVETQITRHWRTLQAMPQGPERDQLLDLLLDTIRL